MKEILTSPVNHTLNWPRERQAQSRQALTCYDNEWYQRELAHRSGSRSGAPVHSASFWHWRKETYFIVQYWALLRNNTIKALMCSFICSILCSETQAQFNSYNQIEAVRTKHYSRSVQSAANRLHAAQNGYEFGPVQNHKFIYIMRFFVITCCNAFHVWPKTTLSSSSVAQRHQKIGHPCRRKITPTGLDSHDKFLIKISWSFFGPAFEYDNTIRFSRFPWGFSVIFFLLFSLWKNFLQFIWKYDGKSN